MSPEERSHLDSTYIRNTVERLHDATFGTSGSEGLLVRLARIEDELKHSIEKIDSTRSSIDRLHSNRTQITRAYISSAGAVLAALVAAAVAFLKH